MTVAARYVRLYTGADYESHFSDEVFPLQETGTEMAGFISTSPATAASHYEVRVVPSGWERGWGPADHPVLAVYLCGEGEIEASDGEVRQIVPGSVLLVEDTVGQGHRVRVTSREPITVIQIHLPMAELG